MNDVVQFSQNRSWDTVTIQQVVTSGHHQSFGQHHPVEQGGANGVPLRHKFLDVRSDLFPMRGGIVRAIYPDTQNSQRRVSRKHEGSVEASSDILMKTGGTVF